MSRARVFFDEGVRLINEQVYDAALARFELSKKEFPTRVARQNVAVILKILSRYDEAADEIDATLRAFPTMKPEDREVLDRLAADVRTHLGTVVVRSTESDAAVIIDGRPRGKSGAGPIRVVAGARTVRVTKEGFEPREQQVKIVAERETIVTLSPAPLVKSGRLRVSEDQQRPLPVFIDGAEVGTTPWEGPVGVGSHAVQLRGSDALGSSLASVEIVEQRLASLTLLAEPMRCSLRIAPTPADARVIVDGVAVGTGAWSGPLRCGGHRIEVVAEEFVPNVNAVSLTEDRPGDLRVVLDRDPGYGRIPTRVITTGSIGVLATPSLGGGPSDACGATCSSPLGVGGHVTADAGVRFGTGFGVAVTGGYLALRKSYGALDASATPVGRAPNTGTSDDTLNVSGPRVGVTASFERGEKWKYGAQLSGGVMFARWSLNRDVSLTTAPETGVGVPYTIANIQDRGSLVSPYLTAGVSAGYEITPLVTLDVGLSALFLFGLNDARPSTSDQYHAGVCTTDAQRSDRTVCPGVLQFQDQPLFASIALAGALSVGVTARF